MSADDTVGSTPELIPVSERIESLDPPHVLPRRLFTALSDRAADYLELTKFRLGLVVLFVTAAGFVLGAPGEVHFPSLVSCLLGTWMLAAGASALNQYLERDFDALMVRTGRRPLPRNRIHPFEALAIGLTLGISGVLALAVAVGPIAGTLGAFTFLSYVLVYTPMKRRTPHALFVGAVPGALPPLIGYAAAGGLGPEAWSVFGVLFIWQIPHFLAIAWLYREDYRSAGFPTYPDLDPDGSATAQLMLWSSLILFVSSFTPALAGGRGGVYLVTSIVLGIVFLVPVLRFRRTADRSSARAVVRTSIAYLPLLFGAMVVDKALG